MCCFSTPSAARSWEEANDVSVSLLHGRRSGRPAPAFLCLGCLPQEGLMAERLVGMVTHYFPGPNVAVVKLVEGELAVGDHVHFLGHTTDFEEDVGSMEVQHHKVDRANPGDE